MSAPEVPAEAGEPAASARVEQAVADLQAAAAADPGLAADVREMMAALNGALLDPSGPSPD